MLKCHSVSMLLLLSFLAHFISDFILHSLRALACGKWKSLTSPRLMHMRVLCVCGKIANGTEVLFLLQTINDISLQLAGKGITIFMPRKAHHDTMQCNAMHTNARLLMNDRFMEHFSFRCCNL